MKQIPKLLSIEEQQLLIAKRARSSRLYVGYTQSYLAKCSSISYATIRKFEQTGEISLKSLLSIAKALDESDTFYTLFKKADFFECLPSKLFKRPKLCKNGTYISTRKPSRREMEEFE